MDVLQAIYTRRSIRKYIGEPITEEQLTTLIKAGCSAPSAHNYQPWHFVVVRNQSTLEYLAAKHPYGKMLPQAGCCIMVCGNDEVQKMKGFLIEDCSASIQNILLAAHGIGLGAVWCGIYPVEELTLVVKEALKLPDNIEPIGMIVVGNKAEEKEAANRYDESKVHFDQW